jgi:mannose-6-phosphate isomerase-like protein (cupin superfamily)
LFEDAFVLQDQGAIAPLFEERAMLVRAGAGEARGSEEIARSASALWSSDFTYLAAPLRVIQAHDLALILAKQGTSVVRRGADGAWRYAISLLAIENGQRRVMTRQTTKPVEPLVVRSAEGEPRWWFEALAVIRATAADTGGLMTIIEVTEPPEHEAPLHVHHREDEAFYILEGSATIHVGDQSFEVGPGDYAFGPRDIPHRYSIGPDGCRMLFICTPGGFENLVRGMSVPAERRELPPPTDEEPDWEHVAAVAEQNGCELLA